METEEGSSGAPRGLLLSLGLVGLIVGAAIAGEFVFNLQPKLSGGTAAAGSVIMPQGVGSNTALNFDPVTITVILGQNNTVAFTNKDSVVHTVTATGGSFNSGDVKPGASWTYTFNAAGTFDYYCIYHSSWMRAKVVVLASSGTSTAGGAGATVGIPSGTAANQALNYSPVAIRVAIGVNNTVTFVNQDSAVHTVTALDGSFDSGDIKGGGSWTHTFTTAGTYSFHCIYHSWMKGTITVVAP